MNRDVWDRLRARCEADGVSMSGRVEQLCEGIGADLVVPRVPAPDAVPVMPPRIPPADRAVLDRLAAVRSSVAQVVVAAPPKGPVRIVVDEALFSALDDQVDRGAALRLAPIETRFRSRDKFTAHAVILDAAINAMLDRMAVVPWCLACLETTEHCACRGGARAA